MTENKRFEFREVNCTGIVPKIYDNEKQQYANLFESESDIAILVRKITGIDQKAINDFVEMQSEKGFNERQLYYIKELLLFISQNGKFERSDLLRQELLFGDLFDNTQINSIIKDVESRL